MGPLELLYYLGYSLEKSRSLRSRKRLPHRVISIGNLTVGGTGKTPAAIAIAEEAKSRGYQPCLLTRGYRGRAKGPCFVSRGEGPLLSVEEAGDEASLMAEKLEGVPIVKGSDRYDAGMFAIRDLQSLVPHLQSQFLFILDDGYQHWRLHRDTDILLIDSTNPFGRRRLLPKGILREPLHEMRRADIVVLTKVPGAGDASDIQPGLTSEIRTYNPHALIYTSAHLPVGLRTLPGRDLPLDSLSGKPVLAFCGIGNPSSFRETLLGMGTEIKGFMAFGDHHRYDARDVQRIMGTASECNADWIVTTEKDIMRLRGFDLPENVAALQIAFSAQRGLYDEIFAED